MNFDSTATTIASSKLEQNKMVYNNMKCLLVCLLYKFISWYSFTFFFKNENLGNDHWYYHKHRGQRRRGNY